MDYNLYRQLIILMDHKNIKTRLVLWTWKSVVKKNSMSSGWLKIWKIENDFEAKNINFAINSMFMKKKKISQSAKRGRNINKFF